MVVCMIAIPQVLIFLILFFAATVIFPLTTPGMINALKPAEVPDACNRFSYGEAEELSDCGHDTGDGADHAYVMVLGELYIAVSIIS